MCWKSLRVLTGAQTTRMSNLRSLRYVSVQPSNWRSLIKAWKISQVLITSFGLFVFFQPTCFRKLRPFLMTQTDTNWKLCLCRLQNTDCLRKCRPNWSFSLPYSTLLSLFPLWESHQHSPPLYLLLLHSFSFSFSFSLSLSCVLSLCARSLSLSLFLRQIPSRSQLGLLVHGFQMFSRDELG